MAKTTVTGSFLARMFPTMFKHFSENASQEEFNQAEQEAAVIFQQQTNGTATTVPAAVVEPITPAAQSGATTEPTPAATATTAEADLSAQLTAQTDRATKAEAELATVKAQLETANTSIATLTPKASAWDAQQAALKGASVSGDATNKGKTSAQAGSGLSDKDQASLSDKQRLAAKYPGLMADLDIPVAEQE